MVEGVEGYGEGVECTLESVFSCVWVREKSGCEKRIGWWVRGEEWR